MIRLIRRRLIIPQGDTGTFIIPTLGFVKDGDKAVLYIYDNLTKTTVLEKETAATPNNLTFYFMPSDTMNLQPDTGGNRYTWDIVIYRNPVYDENNELIEYTIVDSYYAAYRLPRCIIKQAAREVKSDRARTRDLLLDYEDWIESYFSYYDNDNQDGNKDYSQEIIFAGSFDNFPEEGKMNQLYFDRQEKILYYWDNEYIPVNTSLIPDTILEGGGA